MQKITSTLILLFVLCSFAEAKKIVPFNDPKITYMGRVEPINNEAMRIYWPGTSVSINFEGTELTAIIKNLKNVTYFYAIIDGKDTLAQKIRPDTTKSSIVLASGLPQGKHTVQLFKLCNNTTESWFYGFELNDNDKLLAPTPLGKRKIEFYGNSITAGHGVDVPEGRKDSGAPEYFNNYWTYAARTARYFNAQYSCIARSGIGVMVSWFPIIMPEMYDRLNPEDPNSKWDFTRYTPDLVVVNLFQNDKWIVKLPNFDQFKARFGTTAPTEATIILSYQDFIKKIRAKYPQASIICALGSMDATEQGSEWPGYVERAVKGLNDPKIYTHFFPYKNTPGHPKASEQKVMADDLIQFINTTIKW